MPRSISPHSPLLPASRPRVGGRDPALPAPGPGRAGHTRGSWGGCRAARAVPVPEVTCAPGALPSRATPQAGSAASAPLPHVARRPAHGSPKEGCAFTRREATAVPTRGGGRCCPLPKQVEGPARDPAADSPWEPRGEGNSRKLAVSRRWWRF